MALPRADAESGADDIDSSKLAITLTFAYARNQPGQMKKEDVRIFSHHSKNKSARKSRLCAKGGYAEKWKGIGVQISCACQEWTKMDPICHSQGTKKAQEIRKLTKSRVNTSRNA